MSVFRTANQGVGAARNLGLEKARGRWVVFVDGDDWLDAHFVEAMREELRGEAGLIHYGWCDTGGRSEVCHAIAETKELLTLRDVCRRNMFHGYVWSYAFRRDIIERHGLRFSTDVKYAEDWEFILKYYTHIRTMAVLPCCPYHYVQRGGSAVRRRLGERYVTDNFKMFQRVLAASRQQSPCFRSFVGRMLRGINIWMVQHVVFPGGRELKQAYRKCLPMLRGHALRCSLVVATVPFVGQRLFTLLCRANHRLCACGLGGI